MEKRLFIAVLISIAFLFAWGKLMPMMFPELSRPETPAAEGEASKPLRPEGPETAQPSTEPQQSAPAPEATKPVEKAHDVATDTAPAEGAPATDKEPLSADREIQTTIDHPRYTAVLSNRGGGLISFRLKNYAELHGNGPVDLVPSREGQRRMEFALASADAAFNRAANDALYTVDDQAVEGTRIVTYRYRSAEGLEITKEFTFPPELQFRFSTSVLGLRVPYRVTLGPGIGLLDPTAKDSRFLVTGNGVTQVDGSFKTLNRQKVDEPKVFESVEFAGIIDNYFLTAISPEVGGEVTFEPVEIPIEGLEKPHVDLVMGVASVNGQVSGKAYFGPKKAELLEQFGLEGALQLGIFGFIARYLLTALLWVHKITGNYGWAIIVLTILIKIALFPLQHKSIVSMKKMQRVQPKINSIRDKYKKAKSDPEQRQKMNTEMMKLYQKEGINPASGCLPLFLQLPILWAFYMLLVHAIELRGAPWILWIQDLSAKDPYYITPILMTITMFVQQWMTPTAADPTQRKIFLIMPIVFGWIFKEFPSGLVIYWFVQNLLTILQQWIMNRWWKEHPEELEEGA